MAVLYTDQIFGGSGTPILSVSTLGDLPASGTLHQRISITGESALFDTTTYPAIVVWDGSHWYLESCAATYLALAAVEFAGGIWTGTGGTLNMLHAPWQGSTVIDTTYNESWVWNNAGLYVPNYLGAITIANQQKIKGDSLALPGWSASLTYSGTGGLATLTTDGSKLTFYANGATSVANSSIVSFNDAGRTTTSNFYMKCLMSRATDSNWSGSPSGSRICLSFEYITSPTTSIGRILGFGDGDTEATSGLSRPGSFFYRNIYMGLSALNDYPRPSLYRVADTFTTETLVQFRIIGGTIAQAKVGNNPWHDVNILVGAGYLSVATTSYYAGTTFAFGVNATSYTTNKAQGTLRYLQAIRYT